MSNHGTCVSCSGKIPRRKRSDAKYCSDTCRSAEEKRRYRERVNKPKRKNRPAKVGPYKIKRKDYVGRSERNKIISRKRYHAKMPEGGRLADARRNGYRSGFERTLANDLKMDKVLFTYESERIPYILHSTYSPDFVLPSGIIVEAKGVLSVEDKRKMVAVKQQHPHLDIRFVFMKADNKIPRTKQTHGEWATKNGFIWADGTIPKEWYES